jgi:hypothetical protein
MAVEASNPISAVGAAVGNAIRRAAQTTGASFDYLLATAKVESDLNPNLTMRSSSATGLFQFIEQTWLETLKQAGNAVGYGRYASAIKQSPSGQYVVQDPNLRHEIMTLRKDPTANAVMAGVFTQNNAAQLGRRIGRRPSEGELYIAHFFGPAAAGKLINARNANPQASGAAMFPRAANANHSIFYDKRGNVRTVAGVYDELVHRYSVARMSAPAGMVASAYAPANAAANVPSPLVPAAAAAAAPAPVADTAGVTQVLAAASNTQPARQSQPAPPAPSFRSLFSDDERRGAVSPTVAQLWTTPATAKPDGPAQTPASEPAPLDLFRELAPNGRALFKGSV